MNERNGVGGKCWGLGRVRGIYIERVYKKKKKRSLDDFCFFVMKYYSKSK